MTPPTIKHQQLILLEHDKAALLDKLAKDAGISKQALMREAIDNLLAMWGVGVSRKIEHLRDQVRESRRLLLKVRSKHRNDADVARACSEAALYLTATLAELGERKRK